MEETRITISRVMVGISAGLCLVGAVVLWILYPEFHSEDDSQQHWIMLKSACTRIGLVMGALWLALPGGGREIEVSPKVFLGGFAAFVGVVLRPRFVVPMLVVLGVLAFFLRPREKNRASEKLSRWYRVKNRNDEK